ncbi:MAG TPA: thermonuclease family protein [Spirochaetota bacterium]|nr:thermonuclease family protein [Spirochaetota bacterium]HPJ37417.1 thermonuclease family protein [Spirochaetota bacterium]HPQ55134.1 thermonuclease family protein [Spirochaetota bacterium]
MKCENAVSFVKRYFYVPVFVLLVLAGTVEPLFSGEITLHGRVLRVYDGDTIKVQLDDGKKVVVRFLGVDTPESYKRRYGYTEYLGDRASLFAKRELSRKNVVLKTISDGRTYSKDRHGRVLAYVFRGGDDICALLLKNGLARVYRKSPCSRHREFLEYEAGAKREGLGIWDREQERSFYRTQFRAHPNKYLLLWFWEHDRDFLREVLCGR